MTYWLGSSPALLLLSWLLLCHHDKRCSMTSSNDWQWLVSDWAEMHNKHMSIDHLLASQCRTDVVYDCAEFIYLLTLLSFHWSRRSLCSPRARCDASTSIYNDAPEGRQGARAHSDLSRVMSFGYFGRSKKPNNNRQLRYLWKQYSMLLPLVVSVETNAVLKINRHNENQTA